MKTFSIILLFPILIFFLGSCNSNEHQGSSTQNKLKNKEFIGSVLYKKQKFSSKDYDPGKELFFKTKEKEYFIKISEGYLTHEKLLTYENKLIKIKGKIKNGEWEQSEAASINNPTPRNPRTGEYIVVEKIYK